MKVRTGQVWSLLTRSHARTTARVEKVVGTMVHLEGGLVVRKATLERGLRGAKCLEDTDRRSVQALVATVRLSAEETRTASEVKRVSAPRGLARAGAGDEDAARLAEEGLTHAQIAKALGCSPNSIKTKLARHREAEYDARIAKAMGRR